jgi:hypothetical protein
MIPFDYSKIWGLALAKLDFRKATDFTSKFSRWIDPQNCHCYIRSCGNLIRAECDRTISQDRIQYTREELQILLDMEIPDWVWEWKINEDHKIGGKESDKYRNQVSLSTTYMTGHIQRLKNLNAYIGDVDTKELLRDMEKDLETLKEWENEK